MFKTKRVSSGFYEVKIDDVTYEIARYNGGGVVWWGWNKSGKLCQDAFDSKKEALNALIAFLGRKE